MLASTPTPDSQSTLFEFPKASDTVVVNGCCIIYAEDELRVAMVNGTPFTAFHGEDLWSRDLFIAQAQRSGLATAQETADAFDISLRTAQRIKSRFLEGGAEGVARKKSTGRPPSLQTTDEIAVRQWHSEGMSAREMARRLKVAPATVYGALDRLGLPRRPVGRPRQVVLPMETATSGSEPNPTAAGPVSEEVGQPGMDPSNDDADDKALALGMLEEGANVDECPAEEPASVPPVAGSAAMPRPSRPAGTLDTDPTNRVIDRVLASQGQLLDAAPFFNPGRDLPRLGVLLAVPMIVASGLLEEASRLYGHLGPAFYGLRTTLMVLVTMALLRIKRPENLKEYAPPELGRTLGLDRVPEVKTLRRKLARLANDHSETLLARLAKRRAKVREEALAYLYVDGHVRVYNGKGRLPKTHVTRMRISMPAAQDVWLNDANGEPILFVTQEAHPSLVHSLRTMLADVRRVVGKDKRPLIVFDRGGWSPDLFAEMNVLRFDVLTYRKGKVDPIPEDAFSRYEVPGSEGKKYWELHEEEVRVGRRKLKMRQVTRRRGDHQTHIVTTHKDLGIVQIAHRMFNRWRQENFFKYMKEEYDLDALVEYGLEDDNPMREVPNPEWKALDKALNKARSEVKGHEAAYGAAAMGYPEKDRGSTKTSTTTDKAQIEISLHKALERVAELKQQRDAVPKRVTVADLDAPPDRLPTRKKRLVDGLKMLAYQIESDLFRATARYYKRNEDEGRTLLQAAFQSTGDLEIRGNELHVILAPQSSAHRTRVVAELCALLNSTDTVFPGSDLRLRYAIRDASCDT